jgi:hypothetical protein
VTGTVIPGIARGCFFAADGTGGGLAGGGGGSSLSVFSIIFALLEEIGVWVGLEVAFIVDFVELIMLFEEVFGGITSQEEDEEEVYFLFIGDEGLDGIEL